LTLIKVDIAKFYGCWFKFACREALNNVHTYSYHSLIFYCELSVFFFLVLNFFFLQLHLFLAKLKKNEFVYYEFFFEKHRIKVKNTSRIGDGFKIPIKNLL
jgi:hypothetical protein